MSNYLKSMRWAAVALVALVMVGLAACTDDDEDEGDTAAATAAAPAPAAAAQGAAAQTVVQVGNPQAQAPPGTAPSGWDTEYSVAMGIKLL